MASVSAATGPPPTRHTVLAEADAAPYHSLRQRPVTRAERYALGKSLRKRVPRKTLAEWTPPDDRPDPVQLIQANHRGRVERLIPVRVGRMIASPYGFLRGTAVVMADDVARLPSTGIMPVVCGDSHLGNFGFYASPERDLVIDLNDFDEAHPGGWEWDLRRLVASIWVAGRHNGAAEDDCAAAVRSCVSAYRTEVRRLADEPLFSRSFTRLDVDRLAGETAGPLADQVRRSAVRARHRTSDRALPRFTEEVGGVRRIVEEPPLITRLPDREADALSAALDDYLPTLSTHWRRVLGGYTILDVAHKVVGVGSVGLRAYVALLEGSSPEDVVFLQLKQARRSVLARYVHGESAWHAHQGQRVVEYQQALQTVSDPLLGWTTVNGRQFYVRQFRNMKGTIPLDAMDGKALIDYTGVVGQLLAKGHARTSGASMIAGYMGRSERVDDALCTFARRYADQTEADHAALTAAVDKGQLPVERGV
ncbi:uncharacterized protein (DUF2252 family) [Mycolicibacterium iranicum]|uniref:Uncharacterized protein (DUF2252 family) n=1 Tax=Mycolicibacterium iranicum TaxID=912594 RepID=A0A839Q6N5_MYCIR|nr:DUF2252 domain-containing protein [Mycolicibacterium iranicum]MBB2991690.1 uncharacterized protein (DUF2252 family) [Mycolicibacterium iranicum]